MPEIGLQLMDETPEQYPHHAWSDVVPSDMVPSDAVTPNAVKPNAVTPNAVTPNGSAMIVVAADHPSLVEARTRFVDDLRSEQRWFGRSAASHPKPFPSLIARLVCSDGIHLAAVVDGEFVAMACVGADGEASVAVAAASRGSGVAPELMQAVAVQARDAGHSKVFIRSSRRSQAATALGDALGGTVVDMGRGRIDLIFTVGSDARSA